MSASSRFDVVVPAAGVGKRMLSAIPKQYLKIAGKTILEHTLERLICHPRIKHIFVALHQQDPYFTELSCADASWLTRVDGGQERADSVLSGLNAAGQLTDWILVHDAARPCFEHTDIDKLVNLAETGDDGGILACQVRDTMKRSDKLSPIQVNCTVERDGLWHAMTPQFFPLLQLRKALTDALNQQVAITDEASAMEWAGHKVNLVQSSDRNIKITRPDDLALAEFFLQTQILSKDIEDGSHRL